MSTDFEGTLDEVVEELNDRFHRGEQPAIEPYLEQYPQLADPLRQAYEVLATLHLPGQPEPQIVPPSVAALGQLGDFRLLSQIARGGMGIVYEAEQISLGRRVALKTLPMAALLDPRQLQRFQNEARAAAMLDHPHIVGVFSVGCERGVYYYAMQYIDGRTLAEVIAEFRQQEEIEASLADRPAPERSAATRYVPKRSPQSGSPESTCSIRASASPAVSDSAAEAPSDDGKISPMPATAAPAALKTLTNSEGSTGRRFCQSVAKLGIQAAQALEHAHQMGIVHRDIKPSNLMVNAAGHLWVTDFGLAQIESAAELTVTGDLLGTLRYMSPEQTQGDRRMMGHRSDIYSLGATLYELLTLRPVVQERQRAQIFREVLESEPKPLRYWNRSIPRDLETIVLKCLRKQPADRYATARELADDLQRFLDDQPITARRPTVFDRLDFEDKAAKDDLAESVRALQAALKDKIQELELTERRIADLEKTAKTRQAPAPQVRLPDDRVGSPRPEEMGLDDPLAARSSRSGGPVRRLRRSPRAETRLATRVPRGHRAMAPMPTRGIAGSEVCQ